MITCKLEFNGTGEVVELQGDCHSMVFWMAEELLSELGHDVENLVVGEWEDYGLDDYGYQQERLLIWDNERDAENDSGEKTLCALYVSY